MVQECGNEQAKTAGEGKGENLGLRLELTAGVDNGMVDCLLG